METANNNKKKTRAAAEKLHANDKGYKAASNIDFLIFVAGLILAMIAIRAFVMEPVRVDGPSMQNTLQNGERCIVEKVSYWFTKPKTGDIVILHFPDRGNENFVKRVIATEGQTIELGEELVTDPETNINRVNYYVLIDGERLDESQWADTWLFDEGYRNIPITCEGAVDGKYTVPEGCVFVMGDHRTNSQDSRYVGAIPLSDIVGRLHGVIYPFSARRSVD